MRRVSTWWSGLLAACLAAGLAGCPSTPGGGPPGGAAPSPPVAHPQTPPGTNPHTNPPPVSPGTHPPAPAPAPVIPKVVMGANDLATCLVKVGDTFPSAELPDLDGKSQALSSLFGPKLTVVLLWTAGNSNYGKVSAVGALEDMQKDVLEPYSARGLAVIAINVRDTRDAVRQLVKQAKSTYPVLLDTDGAFFARLATARLPRIYLLDAGGKVLWFDIEYSQITRENLRQALRAAAK